jgi:hypothetical protein
MDAGRGNAAAEERLTPAKAVEPEIRLHGFQQKRGSDFVAIRLDVSAGFCRPDETRLAGHGPAREGTSKTIRIIFKY